MYSKHSHRHPRHPGRHGREEFARGRGFDFGPGFGPGPRRGRGGPRARRGDVRAAVLALLADRPMHGYEMIKEIEERSEGAWTPSAGSIYPMLQLLEDEGLIRGEDSDGKRRFTLTDTGRAEEKEKAAAKQAPAKKVAKPAKKISSRSFSDALATKVVNALRIRARVASSFESSSRQNSAGKGRAFTTKDSIADTRPAARMMPASRSVSSSAGSPSTWSSSPSVASGCRVLPVGMTDTTGRFTRRSRIGLRIDLWPRGQLCRYA